MADHDLPGTKLLVETGDVEAAIAEQTLVLIGATERGLLSRTVSDPLTLSGLDELDTGVLLTERPRRRSLQERILG